MNLLFVSQWLNLFFNPPFNVYLYVVVITLAADDVTGDKIKIPIDGIGTLTNEVV